jgi:hypothetical protein
MSDARRFKIIPVARITPAATFGGQTMFRLAHCVPPCGSTNRKGITQVSLSHGRDSPSKFHIFLV